MSGLPPIPTPPALRWREFRIRSVPVLVVASTVLGCFYLWTHYVAPATVVGQVEAVRATVTSRLPGTIARLGVTQFSPVKAGDPIAQVITTDPKVLESSLTVIKAEVELLRASADPMLTKERNQLDYERLRLDLLDQRASLAANRVRLQYAEAELKRVSFLRAGSAVANIASQAEYEIALRDRDALQQEIELREQQTALVETNLRLLGPANATNALSASPDTLRAAISLQEQKLRLAEAEMSPITLTSPITGTVSMVYRRVGENVAAGEPIVTIMADQADRILGFVLPPLAIEPRVGMTVTVRSRTLKREAASAQITEVGHHMDVVPPTMLTPVNSRAFGLNNRPLDAGNSPVEVGVPIAVNLPSGLRLRPGELVDLTLQPELP